MSMDKEVFKGTGRADDPKGFDAWLPTTGPGEFYDFPKDGTYRYEVTWIKATFRERMVRRWLMVRNWLAYYVLRVDVCGYPEPESDDD